MKQRRGRSNPPCNVGARLAGIGRHWEALGGIGRSWEELGGVGRRECRSSGALPMSLRSSGGGRSGTEPERLRPSTTFDDLRRPLPTFADLCRPLPACLAGPHKQGGVRSAPPLFHSPILLHPKLTPSFPGFRQRYVDEVLISIVDALVYSGSKLFTRGFKQAPSPVQQVILISNLEIGCQPLFMSRRIRPANQTV